ncbi:MAG: N-acetylmuramoyl-L-alanine amidase [Limnochordaceae bacterium]|nr:N-acetylmuramoyl-L-alanine amidase [Limnochordaceae bacterium]
MRGQKPNGFSGWHLAMLGLVTVAASLWVATGSIWAQDQETAASNQTSATASTQQPGQTPVQAEVHVQSETMVQTPSEGAAVARPARAPNLEVSFPLYPDFSFSDWIYRTNESQVNVRGQTDPGVTVTINGEPVVVEEDGQFTAMVPLTHEGDTLLRIRAVNAAGSSTTRVLFLIRDTTPPLLVVETPEGGWATQQDKITLAGVVEPGSQLFLGDQPVPVDAGGKFSVVQPLVAGENHFVFTAKDEVGNERRVEVVAIQDREPPSLEITEPQPGLVTRESQVTLAGQTEPGARVTVDGQPVTVGEDGRFATVIQLTADGTRTINVVATDAAGNQAKVAVRITRDTRAPSIFPVEPSAPVSLLPGDLLVVRFRGEVGDHASFDIGDTRLGIPAAEGNPGNYTGIYRIQPEDRFDGAPIVARLVDKAGNEGRRQIQTVSVLDPAVPKVVQVSASDYAVLRTGPGTDYERLTNAYFPTRLEVVGQVGDWYRVKLGSTQSAWVSTSAVSELPAGTPPPQAVVSQIATTPQADGGSRVAITLSEPVPFIILPDVRGKALDVILYNSVFGLYNMRYGPGEQRISLMSLSQPAAQTSQLRINLSDPGVSGYFAHYAGNTLMVDVRPPLPGTPAGLTITIDPGHGADSGAVGPAGLREATINLQIAQLLAEKLRQAGARVIMTHTQETYVDPNNDLNARVDIAEASGSQVFISIHNNALAGANRFTVEGTETYYFNPLSADLASAVQRAVTKSLPSTDRFFAYQSFAVIRQTGMPAILVECNYISNPDIERWMSEGDFAARAAEGIYQGLLNFLAEHGQPPPPPPAAGSAPASPAPSTPEAGQPDQPAPEAGSVAPAM